MTETFALLAFGPDGWGDELLAGLRVTLSLAFATAPVALVFGFVLAVARRSDNPAFRVPATLFATVFKALPELITLFIVYYGFSLLLTYLAGFVYGGRVDVNAFVAGVVALGVVSSSYASEVFMGALAGVARGQHEACDALSLGRAAKWRKVVIPQVMRTALPGLSNLWFVLLKDTALVAVIALPDLLRRTFVAVGATKEPFFFFAVALAIYWAISLISTGVFSLAERRFARGYAR